ncbi:MAG: FeoA domain-containing protein [Clostridia bacterium]|nr:FeoA domain-containing protein [Clostridia bacterium]
MSDTKKMSEIQVGETCRVIHILCGETMRRKLTDIGLIPGTYTECVLKSCGDAMSAFVIRGACIALRKNDLDRITVMPL